MKLWRSIKNHLVPWRGNTHRPHILRRKWLVAFLALALVSEGVILSHTVVPAGPNVFLAAVVRSDVIIYTEEARTAEGGGELVENDLLDAAAQAKAEDMAARGYFSHVGPDGEEPWVWLERAGYEYTYAGENLAVRFSDSKDVVDAWMASPAHRANIIKQNYKEIGVGLAEGTYKGGPATFVVQYFGSPARAVVSAAKAPAPDAQPVTAVAATPQVSEPAVAGAETETQTALVQAPAPEPQPAPVPVTRLSTRILESASDNATWILMGIALLLVVVLALTFFIRIQVQPTDLLLPGAAVALVVITLLAANAKFLPTATQSASVAGSMGELSGGVTTERMHSAFPESPVR